jgi:hypothetical protein
MFDSLFAGWRCFCLFRHSLNRQLPSVFQSSLQCACSCSKVPIAPMGDSHLFCLLFAGRRCLCPQWHSDLLIVHHQWEHSFQCACSKIFHAPMVDSRVARFLQGGGVAVTWAGNAGGSVSIVNSQIYSNTASNVRVRVQNFPHRPDGKISDALASTFACTTAAERLMLWSTSVGMCHRDLLL